MIAASALKLTQLSSGAASVSLEGVNCVIDTIIVVETIKNYGGVWGRNRTWCTKSSATSTWLLSAARCSAV